MSGWAHNPEDNPHPEESLNAALWEFGQALLDEADRILGPPLRWLAARIERRDQ